MQSAAHPMPLLGLMTCQGKKALVTNSSGRDLSNHVKQHPSIAALRCYTRPGHSKGTARSDNSDIIFLQAFLNNVVAKALKQNLQLKLQLPVDVFTHLANGRAANCLEVAVNANGSLTWTQCLGQGWQADVVRETWKAWHKRPATAGMVLSSPDIDVALLGDFCAFSMVFQYPVLFGLGMMLAHQLGNWLELNIHAMVDWRPSWLHPIPLLQGLSSARWPNHKLQVRAVTTYADAGESHGNNNGSVDPRAAQAFCDIYGQHTAACFSKAGSLTLTVLVEHCRNFRDNLYIYFSYSPWLNVGAWLPFQVPLSVGSNCSCFACLAGVITCE